MTTTINGDELMPTAARWANKLLTAIHPIAKECMAEEVENGEHAFTLALLIVAAGQTTASDMDAESAGATLRALMAATEIIVPGGQHADG